MRASPAILFLARAALGPSLAAEGVAVELDADARERLEALGYVDPGAP